jgi:hypothetical protein
MVKDHKAISSESVVNLIRRDNKKLQFILLFNAIAIVFLSITIFWLKSPKIKILRLYEDINKNETVLLDNTNDDQVRKTDILLFVRQIVDVLDFKSRNAFINFEKIQNLSEGKFLEELLNNQSKIVTSQADSNIEQVLNHVLDSKIIFKKDFMMFVATVKYKQLALYKDGSDSELEKEITLGLKMVDRNKYVNKTKLGGWYYGLMLHQISVPIADI